MATGWRRVGASMAMQHRDPLVADEQGQMRQYEMVFGYDGRGNVVI